jgi:uridylate kinase
MHHKPLYKRVLLKLSGESLQGDEGFGIDPKVLDRLAKEIGEVVKLNVQVGLVIGGGNLFRGAKLAKAGLSRISGDHMGMLATIMNAIAMRDALDRADVPTSMMSALAMSGVVEQFDRLKAIQHLEKGRVVLFTAGTGNPLVTTDSAASLRAIEIEADVLLKATNVEGIYDADPTKNPNAELYTQLSFKEALDRELAVMDLTAFCQCRDHHLPIRVFNIKHSKILEKIMLDPTIGTTVQ